jgi:hypothetical protein
VQRRQIDVWYCVSYSQLLSAAGPWVHIESGISADLRQTVSARYHEHAGLWLALDVKILSTGN